MRRLPLLTVLLAVALAAPAQADLKPPMVLPGDAGAASTADWIARPRPRAAGRGRAPGRRGARDRRPARRPAHRHRLLRRPARPRARALQGAREPPVLRR